MPKKYSPIKDKSEKLIRIEKELIKSKAWMELTATACKVYLIFLGKRQGNWFEKNGRKKEWVFTNLNKIEFTYIEAEKEYKLGKSTFHRTVKQLLEVGFLDIIKSGGQLWHQKALYGISDRWKKFGKDEFIPYARPKGIKIGWRKSKK